MFETFIQGPTPSDFNELLFADFYMEDGILCRKVMNV